MNGTTPRLRRGLAIALAGALTATLITAQAASARPATTDALYVPPPNHDAKLQIAALTAQQRTSEANLIRSMIRTPQAVWFTAGSPASVEQDVHETVVRAAAKRTVPVLVAYNIPFRDCAQFSAGGATNVAEYKSWIDGFAAGIGDRRAIVILEPDGLGIIPWYDPYGGADGSNTLEWCQPAEADPATAASDRFDMLRYAVDKLADHPAVATYLDGTHSAWLGAGDIAERLTRAGIDDTAGFFLNVSNYQLTSNSVQYGEWVSECIAYATSVAPGNFVGCPNQYWNGGPFPAKIADLLGEWTGVALSRYGVWSDTTTTPELNTSGETLRYSTTAGATHFVIDTSRNGLGPWQYPSTYPSDGVAQDWCNPPGRGLGTRPTASTGVPLLDAYLWIKVPGESDGSCNRGGASNVDPEWAALTGNPAFVDPAAGQWFPEQALQLARLASPPLP